MPETRANSNRPISTNIIAGLEFRAALANQDRAAQHCFAAESLDAEPLRV
jgi:hypothetical protein